MRRKDILVRFGGEEFIALLSETSLDEALMISERLRQKIAQHEMCIDKKCFNFTVSIGVSSSKPQQTDLQTLIKKPIWPYTKPNNVDEIVSSVLMWGCPSPQIYGKKRN